MSFPCSKCGECCKNIKGISLLDSYHSGDGICYFFSVQKGCLIYKERPDVCRIDDGFIKFFSNQLSLDDYYRKNALMCNQLQENAGLDISYRVTIK